MTCHLLRHVQDRKKSTTEKHNRKTKQKSEEKRREEKRRQPDRQRRVDCCAATHTTSKRNRQHWLDMDSKKQKNENLKLVRYQLQRLQQQLNTTERLVAVSSVQAQAMRKLGLLHASLFMAVNQITEQDIVQLPGRAEEEAVNDNERRESREHAPAPDAPPDASEAPDASGSQR